MDPEFVEMLSALSAAGAVAGGHRTSAGLARPRHRLRHDPRRRRADRGAHRLPARLLCPVRVRGTFSRSL